MKYLLVLAVIITAVFALTFAVSAFMPEHNKANIEVKNTSTLESAKVAEPEGSVSLSKEMVAASERDLDGLKPRYEIKPLPKSEQLWGRDYSFRHDGGIRFEIGGEPWVIHRHTYHLSPDGMWEPYYWLWNYRLEKGKYLFAPMIDGVMRMSIRGGYCPEPPGPPC